MEPRPGPFITTPSYLSCRTPPLFIREYEVPLFHFDLFSQFSIFLLTSPTDWNTTGTLGSQGNRGFNLLPATKWVDFSFIQVGSFPL